MFWEFYQQQSIREASAQAARAESQASRAEDEMTVLRRQTGHLALACQALWELLRQTPGFTDDRLRSKMQEIDLRDGHADGKISPRMITCSACSAQSTTRRSHCIICGAVLDKEHIFE
jgi:hypothetical protein